MKTIFYGGTFDPVHNAHLGSARELLKHGIADQILFVPVSVLPHIYKSGEETASFADRMAMLNLAIQGEPGFCSSDIEHRRSGKSYTIDTLRALDQEGKYGELILFMGSDSLAQLHTWKEAHALLHEFHLAVYPRPSCPVESIDLSLFWEPAEQQKLQGSILPALPEYPGSSSEIRKMIKKNGVNSILPFVRKPVADYITVHHLYC